MSQTAIIIGAGPAGLTAALELLRSTSVHPIVLESTDHVGGIAATFTHQGNHIDLGGHRFFSKSDRVMQWWQEILPIEGSPGSASVSGEKSREKPENGDTGDAAEDRVMLLRERISRIMHGGKFFDYPISLSPKTVMNLGLLRTARTGISYLYSSLFPIRPEETLEDFFVNRFGAELYRTFFKEYTEKVWGLPCTEIQADWGAQRVKELSIRKAVAHALRSLIRKDAGISQKETETSLIERFLYPKYGPGQMWEETRRRVCELGGEVLLEHEAVSLDLEGGKIRAVDSLDRAKSVHRTLQADFVLSSMPVRHLIARMRGPIPEQVRQVAAGLEYRDFITVGLLLTRLARIDPATQKAAPYLLPDNWIYIQEPGVHVGRLQVFNNWSPYLVADPNTVWLGLEFFCSEGDKLWMLEDEAMAALAIREIEKIGLASAEDVLSWTVIHQPKAYPGYFGSYENFHVIRGFVDPIDNLFLIGRNGMHRYNNQDHSMLSAMEAVNCIATGKKDAERIWATNAEQDYHEEK